MSTEYTLFMYTLQVHQDSGQWSSKHCLMSIYVNVHYMSADRALHRSVMYHGAMGIENILEYTTLNKRREMFDIVFTACVDRVLRQLLPHCEFTVRELQGYVSRTGKYSAVTRSILNNKINQLQNPPFVIIN